MTHCTRRQLLANAARAAGLGAFAGAAIAAPESPAPASPVAIAPCRTYGAESTAALGRLFDQLGGLGQLVQGKTVGMKINLTGASYTRLGHVPAERAHWTHPDIIGGTAHWLARAGAARIRVLECAWNTAEPLEEFMLAGGWEPRDILGAAPKVEMENTNWLGSGKQYARFAVPKGGLLFHAYDLNHSYQDCDFFVSIAKMKDHLTAGVTLSMKNCFGMTPCTIYGDGADPGEPSLVPHGGRSAVFHSGERPPSRSAPGEVDRKSPRDDHYRIPRAVADLVAARPIHLAIIDGIETMAGAEGPWAMRTRAVSPGVLIAGWNCVSTDAVAMAVMGYDPMARRGTAPFEKCDSTLELAESLGVGTRDLKRIDVRGASIEQVKFDFRRALA